VAFLLFALQMGVLVSHSTTAMQDRLRSNSHRLAMAVGQVHAAVVTLIGFAVAFP
jgi:hypothetical protein